MITWEGLVRDHHRYIYNLACHLYANRADADDLTQETFAKAFEHWAKFRGEAAVRTWLTRIAINTYCAGQRRKVEHQTLDPEAVPAADNDPARIVVRREIQSCIRHVLQHHVPEQYKLVLVLRDIHGLSYHDIAAILQLSLGAVKLRLYRARKRVLNHLRATGCVAFVKDYGCYCDPAAAMSLPARRPAATFLAQARLRAE